MSPVSHRREKRVRRRRWWLLLPVMALAGCGDIARYIDSLIATPAPGLEDASRDLVGELPVFPGAEGFGTTTPAGRGGDVVIVDSLAASGPGTLREALSGGERTILFAVGGVIDVQEDLFLRAPFVTIAGESAPPPGITVVGAGLVIETHDVLVSHLRIRAGDREEGPAPDIRDALTIARSPDLGEDADVGNIVVDHCSLSWGVDETASVSWDLVHDVTFSHNLIAEGLAASLHSEGEHSKGLIIGNGARRIAVVGNLFAHHNDRSPLMGADTSSLVANNVIYNPGEFGTVHYGLPGCCPALATVRGNVVIPGPDTPADRGHAVHVTPDSSPDSRFFLEDNCGGAEEIAFEAQRASTPSVEVSPLTVSACDDVLDAVLQEAGAWSWDRAAADQRVIDDVRAGTGAIVDTPPGWDALLATAPTAHTLQLPDDPSADDDGDGYTNLEVWLHGLRAR